MKQFRNWTIRTKLTVILMATSTVAVFLAGFAGIAFSVYESQKWHEKHLESIISMISYNSQAALAFEIPEDAERLLNSLDTDESIIMACIYDSGGDLLAVYRQTGYPEKLTPPPPKTPRLEYNKAFLEIYRPIYLEGDQIGLIYVLDNRLDEKAKINRDITVLVLVMLLALLVAYIMSWHLQRIVSGPILSLARTATSIADKKDYSIRALKQSEDEVGTLIDSFNDMLTQIQQAEDILRQSEERYRTLVDNIGLGITLIDKDHNILMANTAIGKMFKVEPSSFIGKKCYNEFEKKSAICSHCPGVKAYETHLPAEVETEGTRDDGSKFPVRVRAFPMFDDLGNPTGFIEVVEDTTERLRAEKILRETQERFTDFFQNAPIGFHFFGPDRLIIDINNAELEMIGYSRDEVLNRKTWEDLIIPEQKDLLEQHWENLLSSDSVKNIEYTLVHKDGHHVDVIVNASARFDDQGNLINTRGSVIDVSERKRMTEQLSQSRQMLKTVLDTINVRVFWKDRNSNYLGCNRLFALDAGLENPSEIIGKNDHELAWKAQADSYRANDQEVIKTGQSKLKYEEPQTTPDGKNIWLSTSKIPLRDKENNIIGLLGTYEDITERKRTDLALRLSEQRFQAIADYTYNWELWISPTGNILWTNPAVERVTGYTIEECMKMKNYPGTLVVPEDRKIAMDARKKGLKRGRGSLECRIKRKDGRIIWVISSWQPIYDKKRVWQGQRVSVRDVTDRKLAEEKLEQSRERFRNLVETTSDWIWEIDTNNVYTYVSPKIRDLLGYEPQEVLGKTPFDLMPENEAPKVLQQIKKSTAAHKPVKGLENVNRHKDGHLVTLETNAVAVYDVYGNFSGYRGIDRDITERKVAEQERERLMWILEAKNRELESIVYTSSHDLRSTIVNVQGFSSELSMTCDELITVLQTIPVPQDTRDTLLTIVQDDIPSEIKYITASASKMDMLINGLLKLSRLGRVETRPEEIEMNSLMNSIVDSMKFHIRESGTKVSVEKLPPCTADVSQITQIFWNLIDNAIKYLDPKRQGKIKISGSVKDKMSVYSVADNGKGISLRHQKNIFEVFHRLEPEGNVPGEGLGLSIIKRIVDRHGGQVRVESTPGKGSIFFIEMPGIEH